MKYVTMPKLTLEQRDAFIEALRGVNENYIPAPGVPAIDELLGYLYSGSTKTVTRKGVASDLMPEFCSKNDGRTAFEKVHDNDGTLVAIDGYKAAVILPINAPEWDMSNAYLTDEKGERKDIVQTIFQNCRSLTSGDISDETLRELLVACAAHKEAHKRFLAEQEKSSKGNPCPPISINAVTMEAITTEQASEMFKTGNGSPMGFNVDYLELSVKFVLCAATEKVETYYSTHISPFHLHADNLYVVVLPCRMGWHKQEEGAA
jgi:hypothetical protein